MTVGHRSVVVRLVECECLSSVHPPTGSPYLDPRPPMAEKSWLYISVVGYRSKS